MNEYFVSVIIPTYQRTNFLQDAIESVLSQEYKNIELIVVDDNAPESHWREKTELFMKRYEEIGIVKYIKHKENMGGCAARNTGIKMAAGEIIAFLDDDDRWKSDYLAKMIKVFENENVGMVYCHADTQVGEEIYVGNRERWKRGYVYNDIISGWCPDSTSLVMVRKACFDTVGLFDVNLKSFQDYDMWLRITRKFEVDYVKENLIVKIESHGEQVSMNPYKREAGMEYLKTKWLGQFDEEQKHAFGVFLHLEERQMRKNYIIYNKKNRIKCNYCKLFNNYCKTEPSIINRVGIVFVILFGCKIINWVNVLKGSKYTRM